MQICGGDFPCLVRAHAALTAAKSIHRKISSSFPQALVCLLLMAGPLRAANHPAVTGKNSNCASCHADMTQGASVHSRGELACGLCHSSTEGASVEMFLTVPKEQICFVCHERPAMQQHVSSSTQKDCLGCHDAHRSARAMLLRRNVETSYADASPAPPKPKKSNHLNRGSKLPPDASTQRHPQHPQATDHEM